MDFQHECPKRGLWVLGRYHHSATLDLSPRPLGASGEQPASVRGPVAARVPVPPAFQRSQAPCESFLGQNVGK